MARQGSHFAALSNSASAWPGEGRDRFWASAAVIYETFGAELQARDRGASRAVAGHEIAAAGQRGRCLGSLNECGAPS